MALSDIPIYGIKATLALSAALIFWGGMTRFSHEDSNYTHKLVCAYEIVASVIIIFAEFSPYILEYFLLAPFPFLKTGAGRAIFYLIVGTFILDPSFGWMMQYGSVLLLITSVFYLIWSTWIE